MIKEFIFFLALVTLIGVSVSIYKKEKDIALALAFFEAILVYFWFI